MTLINQISIYENSIWSSNSGNSWCHLAVHVLSSRLLCQNTIISVYEKSFKSSRSFMGLLYTLTFWRRNYFVNFSTPIYKTE